MNAKQPGYLVDTGLSDDLENPAYERDRAEQTAPGHLGGPEAVANLAVYLAIGLSGYAAAESMLVDGGWIHTGGP